MAGEVAVEDDARLGDADGRVEGEGDGFAKRQVEGVGLAAEGAVNAAQERRGVSGGGFKAGGAGERRYLADMAGDVAVVVHERLLEFGEVRLVHPARRRTVADGDGGGGADGLADESAGAHDARRAEGGVGDADVAAGEEEVFHVARVERAVRNVVRGLDADRDVGRGVTLEAVGVVVVERPAAVGHDVGELAERFDVALGEDAVAHVAAALALAGEEADPVERPVRGAVVAVVLVVVPEAVGDAQKLVAHLLGVGDGVLHAAKLEPPVVPAGGEGADPRLEVGVGGIDMRPGRRREGLGRRHFARLDEAAHAHCAGVGLLMAERLAELGAGLAADAEVGARERREDAVARAVGEEFGADGDPLLRRRLPAGDGGDAVAVHLDLVARAVEEKLDARLVADGAVEDGVPDREDAVGVAVAVVEEKIFDEAGLVEALAAAADPHANLGRGVAAEDGAVVHQRDGGAVARGGDSREHAGEATADDAEVHLVDFVCELCLFHEMIIA